MPNSLFQQFVQRHHGERASGTTGASVSDRELEDGIASIDAGAMRMVRTTS